VLIALEQAAICKPLAGTSLPLVSMLNHIIIVDIKTLYKDMNKIIIESKKLLNL
jgi:hypothetical protein